MKLKEIAIGYIDIPLVTPFKTALRTVNSVNDLIVKVTAEDGTEGYGEAPPTAVITGDTKESIEAAIRYYIAPTIKGMDLEDLPAIMQKLEKCLAKNTTAKAAVDIALYDLYAKLQNRSRSWSKRSWKLTLRSASMRPRRWSATASWPWKKASMC